MLEAQFDGMQHDPLRTAPIRNRTPVWRSIVNPLTAQRRACLAEMNAYLMRSAGLQTAFDECVLIESLDDANMCDRTLPVRRVTAAAPAVTAVANQRGLDASIRGSAPNQRQVKPFGTAGSKLLSEMTFGLPRTSKHDQATGFFIEAVYRAYNKRLTAATAGQ